MIPYSRPKLSDFYTLFESKLAENHTLHSGTYLYSSYMGIPPPPPGYLVQCFVRCHLVKFSELGQCFIYEFWAGSAFFGDSSVSMIEFRVFRFRLQGASGLASYSFVLRSSIQPTRADNNSCYKIKTAFLEMEFRIKSRIMRNNKVLE